MTLELTPQEAQIVQVALLRLPVARADPAFPLVSAVLAKLAPAPPPSSSVPSVPCVPSKGKPKP